jgi:cytosine/adenosine deaminase-related metal-dependent hydrolase
MGTILIKDATVIATLDDNSKLLYGKSILIKDNIIEDIGDINAGTDEVIDCRGRVVVPGFINTHHHLYQTLTRNLKQVQNAKLFDWLKYLYNVWKHIDTEAVDISTRAGIGELLLTGCTTTSDHLYVFPQNNNDLIDAQIQAGLQMGIRFHPSRGSMSLGESEGGLPPDTMIQKDEDILTDSERIIGKYHDPSEFSMLRIVLAPCSPFSVTEKIMTESRNLARKKGVHLHTHLAETEDEERYCLEKKGMRPFSYMEKVGWVGADVWFAHCVHLKDDEIKRLARTKTGVTHCPTSNLRLGSGIAPVRKMLDQGVDVSLGVDGSASNDSSDMLGELRMAMLCARIKSGVDSMSAEDVLYMATRGGAKVLGRSDIGSIEQGKAADLAIFNVDRLDYAGADSDYVGALVFSGVCHIADTVIVNGKIRVRDSKLADIDEKELVYKLNRKAGDLRKKAGIEN